MSETCDIKACKRASCALCYCCKQNVCRPHLNEHQDVLNSQLSPLADQINGLGDRLKTIHINTIISDCREKFEQWRMNCYKKIDDFFERKCQELEENVTKKVDKQQEEIGRVRSKVAELIREEDATRQKIELIASTVRDLESDINKLDQMFIHIKSRSLMIDENMIEFEAGGGNQLSLATLAPAFSKVDSGRDSDSSLASNGRFLLMHRLPNLCLMDRDLSMVRKVTWDNTSIRSMCWSSSLNRFIINTEKGFFSLMKR